ncbi:MAG: hypothetical protein D6797_06520 [Bdellovibrio sp.]|nr:MAG: hypothetical protein D6797_06520 [Bdellovibrio sp.]
MEKICLDKTEILKLKEQCMNLGEVLSYFKTQAEKRGEVVCSVQVNGMTFSEKDDISFQDTDLQEIQSLVLTTESPQILLKDMLQSLISYIPEVSDLAMRTADLFRHPYAEGKLRQFSECLEACQLLTEALNAATPLLKKMNIYSQVKDEWKSVEVRFLAEIKEMLDAFQRKDMVLLSDIIEYNLSVVLKEWQALTQKIRALVNSVA